MTHSPRPESASYPTPHPSSLSSRCVAGNSGAAPVAPAFPHTNSGTTGKPVGPATSGDDRVRFTEGAGGREAPTFPQLLSQEAIDRQERNRRYRELIEDTLGCAALWIIAAIGFFFAGVL